MTTHKRNSGFTLIEMIVSVGLFAVVMLVATGAYLSLISLDRKARSTNDLVTNLSFVVDTMERTMRSGTAFQCGPVGPNCTSGDTSFSFVNDQGQTVSYIFDTEHHSVGQCTGLAGGGCTSTNSSSITDPRITITNLKFYVRGAGTSDQVQPWVTFTITGTLKPDSISAPITFTIESTASQRGIDL